MQPLSAYGYNDIIIDYTAAYVLKQTFIDCNVYGSLGFGACLSCFGKGVVVGGEFAWTIIGFKWLDCLHVDLDTFEVV